MSIIGSYVDSEKELENKIKSFLKKHQIYYVKTHGNMYMKNVPDLLICYKGKFIAMELKRAKNFKISNGQKIVGAKIIESGGEFYIIHSFEDFVKYLFFDRKG